MSLDDLREVIDQSKCFPDRYKEKNIFSISGIGHYENSISNILAFFLDPNEEHGLGDLVLKSFIEACGLNFCPKLNQPPGREVCTKNHNRIDILLEGNDWCIAIENKIYASNDNPLEDYLRFLCNKGKPSELIILSIRGKPKKNASNILYKEFIEHIKNNLGCKLIDNHYNKWIILLREFILNIEGIYMDNELTDDEIGFLEKNYASMHTIRIMTDRLYSHIEKQGRLYLNNIGIKITKVSQEDWGGCGKAIRFYPDSWNKYTNIVILVKNNGKFVIQFYIKADQLSIANASKYFEEKGYNEQTTEKEGTVLFYGYYENNNLSKTLIEFKKISECIHQSVLKS